jgi:hypothetical protein
MSSAWYALIQYPTDRELDLADFVDYFILLVGLVALAFWMLRGRRSSEHLEQHKQDDQSNRRKRTKKPRSVVG